MAHSRQGVLLLGRSLISGNQAVYGAGLGCSQDLELQLVDSVVSGNIATAHAGGVECYKCYKFSATG